jgi:large subunit ribosomal protein L21
MYTVVQLGSDQYRLCEGDTIVAQFIDEEKGKRIYLDKVLLLADGQTIKIGQPYLKEITVKAQIMSHHLAPRVISYKYRARTHSAWKKGHRQKLTTLNITKISFDKQG